MNDKLSKNPAVSIRAKLLAHAKRHGEDFQRVLTRYAVERLLFRLGQTEEAKCYVLKGAMLFVTWPEHVFRSTGDLDLLGQGDPHPEALSERFARICQVRFPSDGIVFDGATLKVGAVREIDKYQGACISLAADLAGARIQLQIDIGFGDRVHPEPKRGIFPSLLPDLPPANILMYPPETVVAEKFEAMIRFGEANSRIKDFYDVWITTRIFSFDLVHVVKAVGGTLHNRATVLPPEMPLGLTDVFATIAEERGLWSGFLRRTAPTQRPPSFRDLQSDLRGFFGPVLADLRGPARTQGIWDPGARIWRNR